MFSRLRALYSAQTGKSSKDIAEEIGVNPSNLSRWTTGKDGRSPPLRVIRWLAMKTQRSLVITHDHVLIIPEAAARLLSGYDGVDIEPDPDDQETE